MDKIYLNELVFYGYHGVLAEETKLGQTFRVSLILGLSTKKAGISDSVDDTVSYAEVYETVKEIVEGTPFKLIEALAEKIATEVLTGYPLLEEVTVKLIKPNPPIPGHYDSVAVEIERKRSDLNG
ncbi:dihydroneopterin aldolase [Listeria monocytogenes]|uniref:7,8-dihydroneopterin aldolase n=2 Tax=Listeria monocytogenes TaxID=1639 RepID=A0A2Z5C4U8_LISMN|nr:MULTISPECIES: dihydroneopterin aldolase [Listeria]EAE1681438.1 dihydroneopterin aldolase [Listeria monocytogenes LIS0071]EAE3705385.1 dihydroneopterin aldolase [Listeria monocytogenes serotype 1/2b]EAF3076237.1 dihydroneopterin aldolase [Listeria monocytogenes serotype 1/2a]EAG6254326.1 dihydroneopterin aldolase [Listeria monocytogenes CFSAN003806]EAG6263244.1 dihydroneopterin aldolase [Listeria monocytogenes CFSAN003725]EAG6333522.1 dihydroneopterin aldolase [Listeria monocytogenes CFSAN0